MTNACPLELRAAAERPRVYLEAVQIGIQTAIDHYDGITGHLPEESHCAAIEIYESAPRELTLELMAQRDWLGTHAATSGIMAVINYYRQERSQLLTEEHVL